MVILIVVMRSWTQIGLMTYIPFYYIDYLKVDPLYAGKLVFVFLFCGAVGTLLGAPIADRFGHRFFVRLSMFLSTVTLPVMFLPAVEQSPFLFVVLGFRECSLFPPSPSPSSWPRSSFPRSSASRRDSWWDLPSARAVSA